MALPPAIAVGVFGMGSSLPKSFDVTGVMGNIGEWEVTAALARDSDTREFSGWTQKADGSWSQMMSSTLKRKK